jgi:Ca2+-binding RTX toxin-like protein
LDNKLYGLAGNDTLNGGTGADTMDGGDGNDTYYVDNLADVVIDSSGKDSIISYVNNWILGAGIENLKLTNISAVLKGTGNALANELTGNSYNNVLDGKAGTDTMIGGAGNDTYYVDNAFDKVVEKANEGTDIVYASVSHKLADNIENLALSGSNGIGGAGNGLANTITGNAGVNRLLGWGGNDTLIGGGGNDTLTGGDGNDIFDFNALTEMGTTSATRDVITDFIRGQDKLDLSTLDANTATSMNDAFSGTLVSSFTAAGQLKFSEGVLYGNTDVDVDAEFTIQLAGISALSSDDFIL